MTTPKPILLGEKYLAVVGLPDDAGDFKIFNDIGRPYLSYFIGTETPRLYLPMEEYSYAIMGRIYELTLAFREIEPYLIEYTRQTGDSIGGGALILQKL